MMDDLEMAEGGGVSAVIAVRREISRYRRKASAERLALYRKHLQVSVVRATPLLAVVSKDAKLDLKGVLTRLRPPGGWPERDQLIGSARRPRMIGRMFGAKLSIWPFNCGQAVLLRSELRPNGPLSIGVSGDALEMIVRIGQVHVATRDGFIVLTLPFELPDIAATAAHGQRVGLLVGHPWFSNPRWIIDRVHSKNRQTAIWVSAGYAPFVMPWRRMLGAGAEEDARSANSRIAGAVLSNGTR